MHMDVCVTLVALGVDTSRSTHLRPMDHRVVDVAQVQLRERGIELRHHLVVSQREIIADLGTSTEGHARCAVVPRQRKPPREGTPNG